MARKADHTHVRQDFKALLAERDHKNTFLRSQLHARIERNAHLEARLLATLDTLDELQAAATFDLQHVQRENVRLARKLEVCQKAVKVAEKEKEDMSNAVLQLVAKVESCNDYSKWHAARIQLSHALSLYPQQSAKNSLDPGPSLNTNATECTCAHAYSPAVVEELTDSLSREQRAHALTTGEAERRIAALESRVAARDAEIARRAAFCQCLPPLCTGQMDLLSDEERTHIAMQTTERNRVLEADVVSLEKELERDMRIPISFPTPRFERSVQTEPLVFTAVSQAHTRFGFQSRPHSRQHLLDAEDAADAVDRHIAADDDNDTMSVALGVLDGQIAQLRRGLVDLAAEKEALHRVLQDELGIVGGPEVELHHADAVGHGGDERDVQVDNSDAYRRKKKEMEEEKFTNILLIEEECIRLMRSEDALRVELHSARSRGDLLGEENARLKEEISKLQRGAKYPTTSNPRSDHWQPQSLDSDDIFLRCSAPATFSESARPAALDIVFPPLQPVSISPPGPSSAPGQSQPLSNPPDCVLNTDSSSSSSSVLATPTTPVDPSIIPLPGTPPFNDVFTTSTSTPPPSQPRVLQMHPQTQPQAQARTEVSMALRIARDADAIARELADARADAEQREREIVEVRAVIMGLTLRGVQPRGIQGVWGAALGEDGATDDGRRAFEDQDASAPG